MYLIVHTPVYKIKIRKCMVVSGGVWTISDGVWSMSGGVWSSSGDVNGYRLI